MPLFFVRCFWTLVLPCQVHSALKHHCNVDFCIVINILTRLTRLLQLNVAITDLVVVGIDSIILLHSVLMRHSTTSSGILLAMSAMQAVLRVIACDNSCAVFLLIEVLEPILL